MMPIKYYDEYFLSWGEVRAAARHDGMSEEKETQSNHNSGPKQLSLFVGKETKDDLGI